MLFKLFTLGRGFSHPISVRHCVATRYGLIPFCKYYISQSSFFYFFRIARTTTKRSHLPHIISQNCNIPTQPPAPHELPVLLVEPNEYPSEKAQLEQPARPPSLSKQTGQENCVKLRFSGYIWKLFSTLMERVEAQRGSARLCRNREGFSWPHLPNLACHLRPRVET